MGTERLPAQGGFSFGDTVDRDVRRLTPNHHLSLDTLEETRFWPAADRDFTDGVESVDDAAAALAERMGVVCNALIDDAPAWFALSGGLDSRMLLAAAEHGFGPNTRLYSHGMNRASFLDTIAAERIADHLGREIRIVIPEGSPMKDMRSPEAQRHGALHHNISAGFVAPVGAHLNRGALDWIPRDDLLIRGNMLELASAIWWPGVHKIDRVDPVAITTPEQAEDRAARMRGWIAALPENAARVVHDFNYIENTLPYAQAGLMSMNHCLFITPACDRRVFELCMAVPFPARRRKKFFRRILKASRPDLRALSTTKDVAEERRARWPSALSSRFYDWTTGNAPA